MALVSFGIQNVSENESEAHEKFLLGSPVTASDADSVQVWANFRLACSLMVPPLLDKEFGDTVKDVTSGSETWGTSAPAPGITSVIHVSITIGVATSVADLPRSPTKRRHAAS